LNESVNCWFFSVNVENGLAPNQYKQEKWRDETAEPELRTLPAILSEIIE